MDGHEQEDIVRYRNKVFLPPMAEYEAQMATHDGTKLKQCDLILQPGEWRIIAQFQDKSCLHANNQPSSAW